MGGWEAGSHDFWRGRGLDEVSGGSRGAAGFAALPPFTYLVFVCVCVCFRLDGNRASVAGGSKEEWDQREGSIIHYVCMVICVVFLYPNHPEHRHILAASS